MCQLFVLFFVACFAAQGVLPGRAASAAGGHFVTCVLFVAGLPLVGFSARPILVWSGGR